MKKIKVKITKDLIELPLMKEIMVNLVRPFLHAFKEGKKARVVNRSESYVPPLCIGVCG